ncbi:MAG: hypothetical protein ACR2NX_05660 [Chthoniobacterales bacterium]
MLAAHAFAEHTGLVIFPWHLKMERTAEPRPHGFSKEGLSAVSWQELETLAGVILLAAFLYWMLRQRTRDPAIFACLLLALVSYLPVSGSLPLSAPSPSTGFTFRARSSFSASPWRFCAGGR